MSAKNAVLQKTGSHHISDENSHAADGISKEQVFLYFSAKWRGKPVIVTMQADRYAASCWNESNGVSTNRLVEWRTYAEDARYEDPEKNGGRGEHVTGTARSALSKLCQPLVVEWLASDAYAASFQTAVAHTVMRKFQDNYSASRRVSEALVTFRTRLQPATLKAISDTLKAYDKYESVKARAFETIAKGI